MPESAMPTPVRPLTGLLQDGVRHRVVGAVLLAVAAGLLWLALSFAGVARTLLVALAVFVAMPAIASLFSRRVLGGLVAVAVTGVIFGGSIAMADSETPAIQVTWFILAYVAWYGFSFCLFGVPLIAVPFPPFILFPWRRLSEAEKRDMVRRCLALGLILGIAAGVAHLPRWRAETSRQTTGAVRSQ